MDGPCQNQHLDSVYRILSNLFNASVAVWCPLHGIEFLFKIGCCVTLLWKQLDWKLTRNRLSYFCH